MAQQMGFQFRYSFERDVYEIFLKVAIGSSGAPTIQLGKGVTSITHNSTGNYTIVLGKTYNKLLDVTSMSISGSSAQAAPIMNVVSETVNTAATKNIILQYRAIDNTTAADPASGEVLMIRIALRNAST